MGTLYSYNSKYDKVKTEKIFSPPKEQSGYDLFCTKIVHHVIQNHYSQIINIKHWFNSKPSL